MNKKIISVFLLLGFIDLDAIKYHKDFSYLQESLIAKVVKDYSQKKLKGVESNLVSFNKNKEIINLKTDLKKQ